MTNTTLQRYGMKIKIKILDKDISHIYEDVYNLSIGYLNICPQILLLKEGNQFGWLDIT